MRISNTVVVRVFASSSLYDGITRSRGAIGLSRAWHCSQVSAEETSLLFSIADSIGRGKVLNITPMSWLVPFIFAFSQPVAPGAMWHSAQATA